MTALDDGLWKFLPVWYNDIKSWLSVQDLGNFTDHLTFIM